MRRTIETGFLDARRPPWYKQRNFREEAKKSEPHLRPFPCRFRLVPLPFFHGILFFLHRRRLLARSPAPLKLRFDPRIQRKTKRRRGPGSNGSRLFLPFLHEEVCRCSACC